MYLNEKFAKSLENDQLKLVQYRIDHSNFYKTHAFYYTYTRKNGGIYIFSVEVKCVGKRYFVSEGFNPFEKTDEDKEKVIETIQKIERKIDELTRIRKIIGGIKQ